MHYDLIVRNGFVATPGGLIQADVGMAGGRIAAIGALGQDDGAEVIDAKGLHVLPGVIDSQVHFREPGLEHKEDLESGTRGAVLGGITTVFEMPNTKPSTTTAEALDEKLRRAAGRAWCDHAFYVGASADNVDQLADLERRPGCAGVKIFMGSSTGTLLVADEPTLRRVLGAGRRRVAVHCEDEERLGERWALVKDGGQVELHAEWRDAHTAFLATERLLRIAREQHRRVHVLHITTAEEMALLAAHKDIATVEVTPQHLTLEAPDCYHRLGSRAQMNPPIREARHRQALWHAVEQGVVDVVGSDHAPHTLEEKDKPYPTSPSGMPGVQTLLPILLDHVAARRLSLARLIDLVCAGPARIFGMVGKGRIAVGNDGDLTLVDLNAKRIITDEMMASKAGWTPFAGQTVQGWPTHTIIRGRVVMRDGDLIGGPTGEPVRFWESL